MNWLTQHLVDDWRRWKRMWSVQWAMFGAFLLPLMQMVPVLPKEIQDVFPLSVRVPLNAAWCIVFVILRLTAQKKEPLVARPSKPTGAS